MMWGGGGEPLDLAKRLIKSSFLDKSFTSSFLNANNISAVFKNPYFLNKDIDFPFIDSKSLDKSYIYFLDSDDFICRDALKALVKVASSQDADYLFSRFLSFNDKSKQILSYEQKNISASKITTQSSKEFLASFKGNYFCAGTFSLIKSSVLKDIRYIDGIIMEDCPFGFDIFLQDIRVVNFDYITAFRREREGSISHYKTFSKNGLLKIKSSFYQISLYLDSKTLESSPNNKDLRRLLKKMLLYNLKGLIGYMIISDDTNTSLLKDFKIFPKRYIIWRYSPKMHLFLKKLKNLVVFSNKS